MTYRILIGVTGSVATIKIHALLEEIRHVLPDVHFKIVATKNALHFFKKSSVGVEVITDDDEWERWQGRGDPVIHIELRKWADLFLLAPMDANTLAKMATGLCDNTLTSTLRCWDFLDGDKKMVLCPAMNTAMWDHPLTQAQLETVKTFSKNIYVIPPIVKTLVCGDTGVGAMEEPAVIAAKVAQLLKR